MNTDYYSKYLKYKNKYMQLKALIGGDYEPYDYDDHDYDFEKFIPEISKQLHDLKRFYNMFETGMTPDASGIKRLVLLSDKINDFYKSLELMDKLVDQWLGKHLIKKDADRLEWIKKHGYKSPIIILEKQILKILPHSGHGTNEFDIIRKIYQQMCYTTKKEYNEKPENQSIRDIRELAVKIYRKIHPELVEQARIEDNEIKRTGHLPEKPVYRIGDGTVKCQS
jgi:hypothetical protein